MKQSSIEWLFDELVNRTDKSFFLEELQQSKEMHEREITKAYHEGQLMAKGLNNLYMNIWQPADTAIDGMRGYTHIHANIINIRRRRTKER